MNSSSGASRGACREISGIDSRVSIYIYIYIYILFSTLRFAQIIKKTHVAKAIGLLAAQVVHHTLAGIEAGTAVVERSTGAQVPETYFIYSTFRTAKRERERKEKTQLSKSR